MIRIPLVKHRLVLRHQTTTQSNSLSDFTSIGIGTNGTISGGTVTSFATRTNSDSQFLLETHYFSDPRGRARVRHRDD
jgi:hypothetical protein